MGDTPVHTVSASGRMAGKWQIPAFAVSLILLAVAALHIKSPERKIGIDTYLQNITTFVNSGLYDSAADLAERLLGWQDLDESTRGRLYQQSARAVLGRAERLLDTSAATAAGVIQKFEQAVECGVSLTAVDFRRMADCYEHLGQYTVALKHHQRAVESAPPPALQYRRRVIELSEYPLRVSAEELDGLLEAFITDAEDSPEDLIWALARRVGSLSASQSWQEAGELLDAYRDRFGETPLESEYGYLIAVSLCGAARYDEAERKLRELLNTATVSDPVYSKAGWLLGRVVMNDGRAQRPEEAISIFREVISSRADRVYVIASRVGMAEALAELYRFKESLESYGQAIDELGRVGGDRLINPEAVRSSLMVTAERCNRNGRLKIALDFLRLAVSLIDAEDVDTLTKHLSRLGDLQAAVARELAAQTVEQGGEEALPAQNNGVAAEVRSLFDEAGENYVRVAWMNTLNEKHSAAAMWTAAGLFDEGGNHRRAIEILQAFVRDRSAAEIIPRVLLRLGRSLQAAGRYAEAIEAYQRDISSFPCSEHANAALIPLAECFMALGAEYETEAENALKQITEDSAIFTPAAAEYRDAMFLLGDLYSRKGEYEKAIPVLDEALQRYPGDWRTSRAVFLAANAFRQSALAVKNELLKPELVGESKRLRAEMRERFEEGARRFRKLTDHLEQGAEADLSELDRLYLQDARLYEAACLFELLRYQDALALYERAAWIYKDSPAALGAYVQVINCYVFLGREEEAVSSLRRAQYLVETIADEQFAAAGRFETREGWKRYFDWVAETLVGN